jgi:transcriptional regulator with XRE-family HTH domain
MTTNGSSRIGPTKIGPLGLRQDLIDLREQRFLTTRQLAAKLEIAHETVRRVEHGQIPTGRVQGQFAEFYDLPWDAIVPSGTRQREQDARRRYAK